MATTTTTAAIPSVDLKSSSSLPIRLGPSLLQPAGASPFTSVRYNHKPKAAVVRPEKEDGNSKSTPQDRIARLTLLDGTSRLTLQDGGKEYVYHGLHREDEDSYVLLLRGEGKDREMVLERVRSSHAVNLASTPAQTDSQALAEQYPHISLDPGDDALDLFGEDDDVDAPPDPLNPFDYRHFLTAEPEVPTLADCSVAHARAPAVARSSTPVVASTRRNASGPQTKKRKPVASVKDKPNPKRVKAGAEPAAIVPNPSRPSSKSDPPRIRLDRKASLRNSSVDVDDSGELILEDEDAVPAARPNAMSLALSGQLGDGPISLRSAASSPAASRLASPSGRPEDGEEIDLEAEASDADADEESVLSSRQPVTTYHFDPLDGEDDEADADVEDLELPSPAQMHKPSVSAATVTNAGAGEDEDDLGEALALALGEDAEPPHESDEESEEE